MTPVTICWIHGWGMTPDVWKEVSAWLPHAEHRMIDWSSSVEPAETVYVQLREAAASTQRIVVAAWSMGGMLAIEALDRLFTGIESRFDSESKMSSRISHLILVDSTLAFSQPNREKGWPKRIVQRMLDKLNLEPEAVLREFASAMFTRAELEEGSAAQDWLSTYQPPMNLDCLIVGLQYLLERDLTDTWSRITAAGIPVSWIHGVGDTVCPMGAVPIEHLSDHQLHYLPTGHVPWVTQPDRFYQIIRSAAACPSTS